MIGGRSCNAIFGWSVQKGRFLAGQLAPWASSGAYPALTISVELTVKTPGRKILELLHEFPVGFLFLSWSLPAQLFPYEFKSKGVVSSA